MAKKSPKSQNEQLFEETLVPGAAGSGKLFDVNFEYDKSKPVECLGMTFPNDDARCAYFTQKLREELKDAVFRKIEGFPIGDDEDILALSDSTLLHGLSKSVFARANPTQREALSSCPRRLQS